jgi:hypothetical protein
MTSENVRENNVLVVKNFRHLPQNSCLHSSGMLQSIFTDISGQSICPIFAGQAVQKECPTASTFEDTINMLSTNIPHIKFQRSACPVSTVTAHS